MLPKGLKLSSGSQNGNVWLSTDYEWYIWIEEPNQGIYGKHGDIVIAKRKDTKEIGYLEDYKSIYEQNSEWLENLNIREEKHKRICENDS